MAKMVSQSVFREVQNGLNTLIRLVQNCGGELYLVSKTNPDLFFELNEEMTLVSWTPLKREES